MRRSLLTVAALILALALPLSAVAQTTAVQCFGPVVNSVDCTNTSTTNTSDGSPGTAAAQTIVNASVATAFLQSQPTHLRVVGYISTAAASGTKTWTLSTSWGGNSLTIFSGLTLTGGQSNVPFTVDCDLLPSSNASPLAKELICTASYVSSGSTSAGTTSTTSTQRTTFTLTASSQQAVTVSSTLSATAGLGLVVQRYTFSQGN